MLLLRRTNLGELGEGSTMTYPNCLKELVKGCLMCGVLRLVAALSGLCSSDYLLRVPAWVGALLPFSWSLVVTSGRLSSTLAERYSTQPL